MHTYNTSHTHSLTHTSQTHSLTHTDIHYITQTQTNLHTHTHTPTIQFNIPDFIEAIDGLMAPTNSKDDVW